MIVRVISALYPWWRKWSVFCVHDENSDQRSVSMIKRMFAMFISHETKIISYHHGHNYRWWSVLETLCGTIISNDRMISDHSLSWRERSVIYCTLYCIRHLSRWGRSVKQYLSWKGWSVVKTYLQYMARVITDHWSVINIHILWLGWSKISERCLTWKGLSVIKIYYVKDDQWSISAWKGWSMININIMETGEGEQNSFCPSWGA